MIDKETTKCKPSSTHSHRKAHNSHQPVWSVASNDEEDTLTNKTYKEEVHVNE